MASPPTAPPGSAPSKLTARHVIDMFAELGLPVTDDEAAIRQKVLEQRDRRLRDGNSPDPGIHEPARRWLKNVEPMQNPQRRPELLHVVYQQYRDLADAARAAALGSGTTTLTPALKENLRSLALTSCKTDEALSRRFLADYMSERVLEDGGELICPEPVPDFLAKSGLGQIALEWKLPAQNCEQIEITREAEGGRSQKAKAVYTGTGTSFVDADKELAAGTSYSYRAYSSYQGVKSKTPAVARAACMGEVGGAKAVFQKGAVKLTWDLPGPGVSVLVFKKAGAAPAVRLGSAGPQPADAETMQARRGAISSMTDAEVSEGVTCHYLIVAEFGAGLWSNGVQVQVSVPKAPPPPPSLSALFKFDKGKNQVVLSWPGAQTTGAVHYQLVRREGSAPASKPDEGAAVQTSPQTGYVDADVLPGHRYSYSVFTLAGDLHSRQGTAAPPVDILAEVTDLKALTTESTVELEWKTPPGAERVMVRRSANPPTDHRDSVEVKLTGPQNAKDENLPHDRRFHYLVCCVYRPDGSTEAVTPGVRISAVPVKLPEPVRDFIVMVAGQQVVCRWTPPDYGQVVVLRSGQKPGLAPGQHLSTTEMDALGERIAAGAGQAVDTQPVIERPYYAAFTVAGAHALAGGVGLAAVVPDVTELTLLPVRDGVALRWRWPEQKEVTSVRIARRSDGWPEGPGDSKATLTSCTRREYEDAAERIVDQMPGACGRFYYVVYTQATCASGQWFAPGTSRGCRADILVAPPMMMRYRLISDKGPNGEETRLKWRVDQAFDDFAGMVLVASQTEVPRNPAAGVTLFSWSPQPGQLAGHHEAWVSLAPIRKQRWQRFFYKLMVREPAQTYNVCIIHPDTSVPIASDGRPWRETALKPLEGYKPGVPKTVVCPRCLEQFPVEQMLFTDYQGSAPVRTSYTLLHRALRQPLPYPTNAKGQRLTRKLCPLCGHSDGLPHTAGNQSNLVIGVIGGKRAGKSSYICSLVEQLQTRVCSGLDAAFLSVSDEGQRRYEEEFFKTQFVRKMEVPVTVGTPAPLIYELTVNGKRFGEERNRSVTLAFYDTAGENLQDPTAVRHMVRYLQKASGVMFLIDPLQVDAVRGKVPASVKLPETLPDAQPDRVINNVMSELRQANALDRSGRLTIPVAVVLTKCDVLRDLGLIEPNRQWCDEAWHVESFDRELHDDMAGMMSEYVSLWSRAAYNVVTAHFSRFAFFGVSATGCGVNLRTAQYPFVSPWRVEDPLLWLLAELGVIPVRKGEL